MKKKSTTVYSTNPDWQPEQESDDRDLPEPSRQNVKVQRETKGRGGKTVTVVYGLHGDLKPIQKELQKLCATGGSSKNGQIEIQGDHGPRIRDYLIKKGYRAKLSGGY